jgi:hypothetical protein
MSIFAGKPPVSNDCNWCPPAPGGTIILLTAPNSSLVVGGPLFYVLVEWEEGKSTPDRQADALYWVPGRSICVHCPLNWLYGLLLSCRVVRIYGRKS